MGSGCPSALRSQATPQYLPPCTSCSYTLRKAGHVSAPPAGRDPLGAVAVSGPAASSASSDLACSSATAVETCSL